MKTTSSCFRTICATSLALSFAHFARAAQIYANPFAGASTVPAGEYGEISLADDLRAASYVSQMEIAGGTGAFGAVVNRQNDRNVISSHTLTGWFKVDELPTGEDLKTLYLMRSTASADHSGLKVAVGEGGALYFGKMNWNSGNTTWQSGITPVVMSTDQISAGAWFHLAVSISFAPTDWLITPTVYVNGRAATAGETTSTAINLNGSDCQAILIGAGVSVAGMSIDDTALTDVEALTALATAEGVVSPVGAADVKTESDLAERFSDLQVAGNCNVGGLTIPATRELPAGSTVLIRSIGFAVRNDQVSHVTLSDAVDASRTSHAKAYTANGKSVTVNGTAQNVNWVEYFFNDVEVTVGSLTPCHGRATPTATANAANFDLRLVKPAEHNAVKEIQWVGQFSVVYEIKYVVKHISGEAVDYVCTIVDGVPAWNFELPEAFSVADTVTVMGAGELSLDRDVPGALTIEGGASVVANVALTGTVTIDTDSELVLTTGALNQTQVRANRGKIVVRGGTEANPVVINEDGGLNTSVGPVEVEENSCLKSMAVGAGNRNYTITGQSSETSVVLLTSDHNWGVAYTEVAKGTFRNCKLVIGHEFWLEKNSMVDASVNLKTDVTIHLGWNSENASFELGSLSGSGNIAPTGSPKLNVNVTGEATYSGECKAALVKKGEGTLILSKENSTSAAAIEVAAGELKCGAAGCLGTGTITVDETGVLNLNGYTSNANGYAIVGNGGTIKSDRAKIYGNVDCIGSLTLNADTTVSGGWRLGLTRASGETSLTLNGHTLNLAIGSTYEPFNFRNTTVTDEGTIAIGENSFVLVYDNGGGSLLAENARLTMTATSKLELNTSGMLTVKDFEAQPGAAFVRGNDNQGTLKVLGTYKNANEIQKLELADGAVIAVDAVPASGIVASATQSLTVGDNLGLSVGGVVSRGYDFTQVGNALVVKRTGFVVIFR